MASDNSVVAPDRLVLNIGGDNNKEWKLFKQRFQLYLLASEKNSKSEETKVALLLTVGGNDLLQIYNSFEFPQATAGQPDPANVLDSVISKFDGYFAPRKNELASRYKFRKCVQQSSETIEAYITKLKILIKDCEYEDQRDKELRDQIVFGCFEDKLRQKFFEVETLTLPKTIEIAVSYEASRRQMALYKDGSGTGTEGIAKVKARDVKKNRPRPSQSKVDRPISSQQYRPSTSMANSRTKPSLTGCRYCGGGHQWKKKMCPAYGAICGKCKGPNHYASMCKSKTVNQVQYEDEPYTGKVESDDSEVEFLLRLSSGKNKGDDKEIRADFEINGQIVNFQVDCGSSVNVIPSHYLSYNNLSPCNTILKVWNSETVIPLGKCRQIVRNCRNRKKYNVEFYVVADNFTPLLCKKTSEQMGLITVNYENICATTGNDILGKFKDVFDDNIGAFHDPVHLTLKPDPEPVAISKCKVPINLKKKVKAKLCELERLKIIEKVEEPTDWVSRMVTAVKKSGDLRICIDPQALNQSLKRELHPLPVIDDILPELSKARVFSSFDLKNGYWHCKLDKESSKLTTFQTPFGRYKWQRLPFGLCVSSEIFQKRLCNALENLDGVVCIADDILVYGVGDTQNEATQDHDAKVCKLLERCRSKGIKLSRSKVVLRKSEVSFLGHVISDEGLKADPSKIDAIVNMDPPKDVSGVQCLSGMVNYLSRFLPHLSDIMEPIRMLTHQDVEFKWSNRHDEAFKELKKCITNSPVLQYYDPSHELVIQCDASQSGLGAVLLQNEKAIAYASRALTETEKRYAQIEKEMLSIVFSLNKYHQYVYGRKVLVENDHKPISSIVLKPLCNAPKRLQGMLLNILQYDVEVIHKKGKEMYIADALSRSYLPLKNHSEVAFEHVNMVEFVPIRQERLDEIKVETENDQTLQVLKATILKGWPEEPGEIHPLIKAYSHAKDEFSIQDGLIFKSNRIVIPLNLRDKMKNLIHSSHLGIESCLRRARECIFWPGMNSEIKQFITSCDICNKFSMCQQKESLMCHEISDRPWQKVGVDLMTLKNNNYLLTVDYFSNFWEVDHLENTLSCTVIRKLKSHFSRYGLPSIVVSDNGPQFVSEEFFNFSKEYDFEHRTSSPTHAQSNGMAESAVKTAKRLINKAIEDGRDPYLAILDFRNTPTVDKGASPAQYCLGRRTRTKLPMSSKLLESQNVNTELAKEKKKFSNAKSKWYYDRNAKDLEPLIEDDSIRMKPFVLSKKEWNKGKIIKRLDDRSYLIESDGKLYRRNRVHIRKSTDHKSQSNEHENISNPIVDNFSGVLVNDNSDSKNLTCDVESPEPNHNADSKMGQNTRPVRSTRSNLPSRFKDYDMAK